MRISKEIEHYAVHPFYSVTNALEDRGFIDLLDGGSYSDWKRIHRRRYKG